VQEVCKLKVALLPLVVDTRRTITLQENRGLTVKPSALTCRSAQRVVLLTTQTSPSKPPMMWGFLSIWYAQMSPIYPTQQHTHQPKRSMYELRLLLHLHT